MSVIVKRVSGFLFSAIIAVVLTYVFAPAASYAQGSDTLAVMAAAPDLPKPSPFPEDTPVDWTVTDTATWNEAVTGIKKGGYGKNYTVAVAGDIVVPVSHGNTFGSARNVTVILKGSGTLSLVSDTTAGGDLLSVGAKQAVYVGGTLILRGREGNSGSVVAVNGGGAFHLGDSAAVTGNAMRGGNGGGVFVRSGKFIMYKNSSVFGNSTSGSGGGVFVNNGEFEMYDRAKVSDNKANGGGGGVYIENGKFLMTDTATVSDNTVWLGGGVYVGSAGTFFMRSGAIVSGNTAYRQGGGVYFAGKEFIIKENAAVSDNTASRQGSEVYFAGQALTIQDSAKISGNTDDVSGGVYFVGKAPAKTAGGEEKKGR